MISDDLVNRFATAIAKAEGFYVPDSLPARAHNPGDLTDDGDIGLGFEQSEGPGAAEITRYATDADGWAALTRKVRRMLSGGSTVYTLNMTINQVGMKYARSEDWGINVARELGVTPSTPLVSIVAQDRALQAGNWPNA